MPEPHKAYLDNNGYTGPCAHCGQTVIRRIAGTTHSGTMQQKHVKVSSSQRCYAGEAEIREMDPRISGRRFASLEEVSNDVIAAFGKKACTFALDIVELDEQMSQEVSGCAGFPNDDDNGIIKLSQRGQTEGVLLHELTHIMVARVHGFLRSAPENIDHCGHFLEYELVLFSAVKGPVVAKNLAMAYVFNNAISLEEIPKDCCFSENEYITFCQKWEEKMKPREEPTWKNQPPNQIAKALIVAIKKCLTGKKLLAVVDETERFLGLTGGEDLALTVGLHAAAKSLITTPIQSLELSSKLSRLAFDTTSDKSEIESKRNLLIKASTNISKAFLSGTPLPEQQTAPVSLEYAGQTI